MSAAVAACSATVGWGYYLTGLPVLLWFLDAELGVQSIWLMFVATWLGNGLKDLLCAPRPLDIASEAERKQLACSVSSLDTTHSKEYGAPSTHTMNSLAMNMYLVLALERRQRLPAGSAPLFVAAACVWSAWLAFGRIYSVLHTPGDTYLGFALGLALAVSWASIDDLLMGAVQSSPWAAAYALVACMLAILLYPKPLTKHTPSHDQVVCFGAVAFGAVAGVSMVSPECLARTAWSMPVLREASLAASLLVVAGKVAVGGAILVVGLKGSRPLARPVLGAVFSAVPQWLRSALQPPMHQADQRQRIPKVVMLPSGRPADVEMLARFVSYGMVGLGSVWGAHTVFCQLGLS